MKKFLASMLVVSAALTASACSTADEQARAQAAEALAAAQRAERAAGEAQQAAASAQAAAERVERVFQTSLRK